MRRLLISSICLSLICTPFTSNCALPDSDSDSTSNSTNAWLKGHYVNKTRNYEINYPAQWEKKQAPGLDVILFAPMKRGALHSDATMNIISEKIGTEVSLEQLYSESLKNLTTELKETHIEASGEVLLNKTPSKWVRYTHLMNGAKFTVLQYFILAQETIYLMTFSSPTDLYQKYQSDFENIASSFHITSASNGPSKS
jgi:hypothetical protein